MQTLLQNEGVFRQLCQEPASGAPVWCNAAAERYSAIYSAGGERRASHSHTSRAPPPLHLATSCWLYVREWRGCAIAL